MATIVIDKNMTTTFLILLTHFVSDFILQTDKQAVNKGKSVYWLSMHVLTYTLGFAVFVQLYVGWSVKSLDWLLLNCFLHWTVDLVTSRVNSYLWSKNWRHWFFVGIGADQLIHYACLLFTYEWLILK